MRSRSLEITVNEWGAELDHHFTRNDTGVDLATRKHPLSSPLNQHGSWQMAIDGRIPSTLDKVAIGTDHPTCGKEYEGINGDSPHFLVPGRIPHTLDKVAIGTDHPTCGKEYEGTNGDSPHFLVPGRIPLTGRTDRGASPARERPQGASPR